MSTHPAITGYFVALSTPDGIIAAEEISIEQARSLAESMKNAGIDVRDDQIPAAPVKKATRSRSRKAKR